MTVALPCMAMGLAVYGDVGLTVYGDVRLTVYGYVPPGCDGHLAGDDFAGMVDSVWFAQTDVKLADFIHRADRSLIGFAYRLPAAFLALSLFGNTHKHGQSTYLIVLIAKFPFLF